MILRSLTISDYRVFRGRHVIDLTPRERDGQKRSIILFGGLNGAGKTSILSAIRLVLYGPSSFGRKLSKRVYHEHLLGSIHRSAASDEQSSSSSIELECEHGERGEVFVYRIIRRWRVAGEKVEEDLQVHCNGEHLKELGHEHCQAFLNELVPIGVSDLFFFDGEKIADLAEEEGSAALREAINRLMGVDILRRLQGDLVTYLEEQKLKKLSAGDRKEFENLDKEYRTKHDQYETLKNEKAELDDSLQQLMAEIATTERLLGERGGAWASSRSSEKEKVEHLLMERNEISEEIRHILSGVAPMFLARKSLQTLLNTLETEQDIKRQAILQDALKSQLTTLKSNLSSELGSTNKKTIGNAVDRSYNAMFDTHGTPIVHDLSETGFAAARHTIEVLIPEQEALLKEKSINLEGVEEQIELSSKNMERSPDEAFLKQELERLRDQTKQRAELEYKINAKLEEVRRALRDAIDTLRKQKRWNEEVSKSKESHFAADYATRSRQLLTEFAVQTTQAKVQVLEAEFARAIRKLARKDDHHFSVSIDPRSFAVTLKDSDGNTVNRQELSAGEKQIYAIAMLEALGRTTGRNLPVIIDTPLGRLDSKHRDNLIHNYFPTASHQVIILSTDTEVDEDFFNSLQDEISHGYEIHFDSVSRSSSLKEGYFWNHSLKEAV